MGSSAAFHDRIFTERRENWHLQREVAPAAPKNTSGSLKSRCLLRLLWWREEETARTPPPVWIVASFGPESPLPAPPHTSSREMTSSSRYPAGSRARSRPRQALRMESGARWTEPLRWLLFTETQCDFTGWSAQQRLRVEPRQSRSESV